MNKNDLIRLHQTSALQTLPADFHKLDGAKKLDAILSVDEPGTFVRSLASEELYMLVHDIGASDCTELLVLASHEQRQSFIDLDCWVGHELDVEAFDNWLDLIKAGSAESLIDTLGRLDSELLVDYIQRSIHYILDRSQETELLEAQSSTMVVASPDQEFHLVLPHGSEETVPRLKRVLTCLYRFDQDYARAILNSARVGLRIESEELAYRFRVGRMCDMGFPEPDDAFALYAPIQIDAYKAEVSSQEPISDQSEVNTLSYALAQLPQSGSFLNQCISAIEKPDRIIREFALCVNRAVIASDEGAALKDLKRLAEIGHDIHATVSLGLEYVSDGSVPKGADILQKAWLIQLFQVGHRLTIARSTKAQSLVKRGGGLFEEHLLATIAPLNSKPQPRLMQNGKLVPFSQMSQLATVDELLAEAENTCTLFEDTFGFTMERFYEHTFKGLDEVDKRFIRFTTLARTALAHVVAGSPLSFEPLTIDQLRKNIVQTANMTDVAESLIAQLGEHTRSTLEEAANSLHSELSGMKNASGDDARYLTGVVLVAPHEPKNKNTLSESS